MRESAEEREGLRSERHRLGREHAVLRSEGENLIGSVDVAAMHVHVERLRRHQAALHASLESFHQRFGPLD